MRSYIIQWFILGNFLFSTYVANSHAAHASSETSVVKKEKGEVEVFEVSSDWMDSWSAPPATQPAVVLKATEASQPHWFSVGFWPSLLSTLIGIIAGLPVALWVNSLIERAAIERQTKTERRQLHAGLVAVTKALNFNIAEMQEIAQLPENYFKVHVDLDSVAWDSSKYLVIPLLNDPEIQHWIALHFAQVSALAELSTRHRDLFLGSVVAMSNVDWMRESIRVPMVDLAGQLVKDANDLKEKLEQISNSL